MPNIPWRLRRGGLSATMSESVVGKSGEARDGCSFESSSMMNKCKWGLHQWVVTHLLSQW